MKAVISNRNSVTQTSASPQYLTSASKASALTLLAMLSVPSFADANCSAQNTVVLNDSGKTTIDGRTSNWQPGDTICIQSHPSGVNGALKITNLQGTEQNPITLINTGGQVVFNYEGYTDMAIIVHNSRFLHITGTGSVNHTYGFKIDGLAGEIRKGVGYYKRSSDIELDHVEVGHVTSSALGLTTFSNCSDGSVPARYRVGNENGPYYPGDTGPYYDAYGRELVLVDDAQDYVDNFMHDYNNDGVVNGLDASSKQDMQFNNAIYHDNYIHDTGTEGMYIGSNAGFRLYKVTGDSDPFFAPGSAMGNNERRICQYWSDPQKQNQIANGAYNEPISGQLNGVKIYNTIIDKSGWDSINVKSSATDCDIFDNKVTNFATKNENRDQINAIDVQINTHCNIYRNEIRNGNGVGIHSPGLGGVIANNLIENVGNGYCDCDGDGNMDRSAGREAGMIVAMNTDDNHHYMVDENDTILPWSGLYAGHQYLIFNNTIINPVAEAIKFSLARNDNAIVNNIVDGTISANSNVTVLSHNITADNGMFEDSANGNYQLLPSAVSVVDAGADVASLFTIDDNLTQLDLIKTTRPLQGAYDIGAYEYASLRVDLAGGGVGVITSDPVGINCGSECAFTYADTTTVILTATAGFNSHFVSWSGCDSENANLCTVSGHKRVTATFDADSYNIASSAGANGSISPAGDVVIANGADSTFYFTPQMFYKIDNVLVDGVSVGAPSSYTFNAVNGNHTIAASFVIDPAQSKMIDLKLDEQSGSVAANDGTLTTVDGQLVGDLQWTTDGFNNGALALDGNDYVNLGQPQELEFNPANDSFSLSIRFKTDQSGALISKVSKSSELVQYYLFVSSDTKLYARSGSNSSIKTTGAVNDNQWHTATMVNDTSTGKFYLYLDGNLVGSKSAGNMPANGMDVLIGARRNGSNSKIGFPYSGVLDDVKIFNRALSAEEVATLD